MANFTQPTADSPYSIRDHVYPSQQALTDAGLAIEDIDSFQTPNVAGTALATGRDLPEQQPTPTPILSTIEYNKVDVMTIGQATFNLGVYYNLEGSEPPLSSYNIPLSPGTMIYFALANIGGTPRVLAVLDHNQTMQSSLTGFPEGTEFGMVMFIDDPELRELISAIESGRIDNAADPEEMQRVYDVGAEFLHRLGSEGDTALAEINSRIAAINQNGSYQLELFPVETSASTGSSDVAAARPSERPAGAILASLGGQPPRAPREG